MIEHLRDTMECLGIVEGITSEGRALVRCDGLPDIGSTVFDGDRRRIGTVKRILGPVDAPYASVSGDGVRPELKGKKLFFNKSEKDGGYKRKGGKKN